MSTASPQANLAAVGGRLKLLAILMIVLGVVALLCPLTTGIAIAYLVGALIVIGGIVRLAHVFQSGSVGEGIFGVVVGAIMVIGGIVMLLHPVLNLTTLTLFAAIYFVVEGLFLLVGGFRMSGKPGWGFVVFNGVVTLLLGVLIWTQWPLSAAWALGILFGIHLIMMGLQMLTVGNVARRLAAA